MNTKLNDRVLLVCLIADSWKLVAPILFLHKLLTPHPILGIHLDDIHP